MAKKCLAWYELPETRWRNNSKRYWERDSQRQKLYDAEQHAKWKIVEGYAGNEINREFNSLEEIQTFVNMFTRTKWFIERFDWRGKDNPEPEDCDIIIKDKPKGGGADAHYWSRTIRISSASMHMLVVLHEIAHIVKKRGAGSAHGRYFARTMLDMVECVIGKKSARILKEAFKKYRVKYLPKRELSDETKEKLRKGFKRNVLNHKLVRVGD